MIENFDLLENRMTIFCDVDALIKKSGERSIGVIEFGRDIVAESITFFLFGS